MDLLSKFFAEALKRPELGVGWLLAIYLLWRLHQVTDRQHEAALGTTKVLAQIKQFLVTKFGGGIDG